MMFQILFNKVKFLKSQNNGWTVSLQYITSLYAKITNINLTFIFYTTDILALILWHKVKHVCQAQ